MDISLVSEWNTATESKVSEWVREKLTSLQEDPPDDELVSYIAVMVGNKKKMSEIHKELKDFIEEDITSEFVTSLSILVKNINESDKTTGNTSKSNVKSIPKSSSSSDDKLSKALSSGRQRSQTSSSIITATSTTSNTATNIASQEETNRNAFDQASKINKTSRLLQSALSSTRDGKSDLPTKTIVSSKSNQKPTESIRIKRTITNRGDDSNNNSNGSNNNSNNNQGEIWTKRNRSSQHFNMESADTVAVPKQFLENMKLFASMQGFSSVDEMMKVNHGNMMPPPMAMMMGMNMGIPPPRDPMLFHPQHHQLPPFMPFPEPFHHGPPPFPGGRSPQPIMGIPFNAGPTDMSWQDGGFRGRGSMRVGNRGGFHPRGRGYIPERSHPGRHQSTATENDTMVSQSQAVPMDSTSTPFTQPITETKPVISTKTTTTTTTPSSSTISVEPVVTNTVDTSVGIDRFSGRGRGGYGSFRGRGRGGRQFLGRDNFGGRASYAGRTPSFQPQTSLAVSGNKNKVWVRETDIENPLVAGR